MRDGPAFVPCDLHRHFAIWRNDEIVAERCGMRDFMDVVRALADENRVRALLALRRRELCVCQLMELLHLAASTVSKHLSILKHARLVECRRDGRWCYYRLSDRDDSPFVRSALAWVQASFDDSLDARQIEKCVRRIEHMNLEDLCCRASALQCGPGETQEPRMEEAT